jgi:copper(I)-binding protein
VSRSIQLARRLAAAVAVGATALLATACSAGQTAQTAMERSTVDGAAADVGTVALRNVRVAYPSNGRYTSGSSASLEFSAVNTGMQEDELISVRADLAGSVVVHPASDGAVSDTATPSESVTPSGSSSPSTSGTASGSASSSASGTASGSASGSASPTGSTSASSSADGEQKAVTLPPGTLVVFSNTAALVQLTNLATDLVPGQIVQVTFTFAKSGTVTVPVPVGTPQDEVQKAPPVSTAAPTEQP